MKKYNINTNGFQSPPSGDLGGFVHYLLLLFGILCISWSAILVKLADVSGFGSGFYRLFFGTLGIIPVWLYFKKPITDLKGVKVAIICGVLFACDIALWNTSIMLSKASISTLLANLAPVWVGIGSLLFMKEKPNRIFWIGTAISIFGVTIIIGLNQILEANLNLGNGLAIVASMFYGAYLITVREGRNTLDTFSFTAISMISSTVVLGLICLFTSTPLWGFSTHSWLALIALGLVPQLLGWLAINQALGHIKPTIASVSLLSQTVFTAIFSVLLLGEILTFHEIGGAVVVLVGIYLVNKKK
ncbi:MAG: DMT family transporter [Paludibacter sp.]